MKIIYYMLIDVSKIQYLLIIKERILDMNLSEENNKELQIMRKNLKFLRTNRNWSIKELSEISRITPKMLKDIEEGENFKIQYLIQLCHIYHIKPRDIFSPIA